MPLLAARPTALVTVPDEAGGVHLLWRPPVDPTGPGPGITGYRVRVSVNDGISWQVETLPRHSLDTP